MHIYPDQDKVILDGSNTILYTKNREVVKLDSKNTTNLVFLNWYFHAVGTRDQHTWWERVKVTYSAFKTLYKFIWTNNDLH